MTGVIEGRNSQDYRLSRTRKALIHKIQVLQFLCSEIQRRKISEYQPWELKKKQMHEKKRNFRDIQPQHVIVFHVRLSGNQIGDIPLIQ